jgi:metal-sulfur cluster biosynthetic enzyme
MTFEFPFPYCGDIETGTAIAGALQHVVDPELAVGIVDLGLIYGVEARNGEVLVRLTMTSAACPVTELIVEDVQAEIARVLGDSTEVQVDLTWDPPWSPKLMSARARRALEGVE